MKNNNQKYFIDNNNSRKIVTQIDNNNIYEYNSSDAYNYRKKNNQKENVNFTNNSILRKIKTKINNNITKASKKVEYFSETEDSRHQRYSSLNKGINTFSTNIINSRKSNRVDLSNIKSRKELTNTQNQNINKYKNNKNIKIGGFELCYESDKGEKILYENLYYKSIAYNNIDNNNNKIKINSDNINYNNRINDNYLFELI